MSNEDLITEVQTTSGLVLEVIDTSRKNRPHGLRKPYEYVLPRATVDREYDLIRNFLKDSRTDDGFQCISAWKKGLTKGFKLTIFILGYTKGLCDNAVYCGGGVTKDEWETTTFKVQEMLTKWLGPDARAYIDEFNETDKFSFHFQAYIAYQEMI